MKKQALLFAVIVNRLTIFCLLCTVFVNCATTKQKPEVTRGTSDTELQKFEWLNYTVQQGDTVSSIAKKFDVSMEAVIICNNITNVRELQMGQELRIPNMNGATHTVKAKETIALIANKYHEPQDFISEANNIGDDTLKEGEVLFIPGAYTNK